MTTLNRLILPETYEDLTSELGSELEKMVQFVVPVEEAERQLAVITQTVKHSGKIVFLLGPSGTSKSTFIKSLTWRQFLPIPEIIEVDASKLAPSSKRLELLFLELQRLVAQERRSNRGL